MDEVIRAEGLHKRYGDTVAVEDVSLRVKRGEIFGIVGPNGAGKTTTVETLVGLRAADRGQVSVLGLDPQKDRAKLSRRIGVQLQQANLPERLRVWEALDLFASFYDNAVPYEPLIERWGLTGKRDAAFSKLSGGQQQRLFIALSLVNDPEVVFLDEITTGLDPQARHETWELIRQVRDAGKTVVLVSHFMEEVEALCDRVAIVDGGRVIAIDSPRGLIDSLGADKRLVLRGLPSFDTGLLQRLPHVSRVQRDTREVVVEGSGSLLVDVIVALHEAGLSPEDVSVQQPTLEDVFLLRTGRSVTAADTEDRVATAEVG